VEMYELVSMDTMIHPGRLRVEREAPAAPQGRRDLPTPAVRGHAQALLRLQGCRHIRRLLRFAVHTGPRSVHKRVRRSATHTAGDRATPQSGQGPEGRACASLCDKTHWSRFGHKDSEISHSTLSITHWSRGDFAPTLGLRARAAGPELQVDRGHWQPHGPLAVVMKR
jgi:hypothetical protein